MSVRRRVPEGRLSDILGHLLDVTDDHLEVLSRGEVLRLPVADVTAAKVVPAATPRRGWEVPSVSPDDMQRICWAGWPAREIEALGEWALRAHGGITGRANSAMAVGDPGVPVPEALRAVEAWYAERGFPALLQLPLGDPANLAMAEAGWPRLHVTVVQVAPIAPVLARVPEPTMRAVVEPTPSRDWLSVMHDLDDDVDGHVSILAAPPVVGFAMLYAGSEPLAIGRVSVEGEWCGITSVDVVPAARRRGLGSQVMAALLGWAQQQGATSSYLQVRAANPGALKLYDALGYVTHHPYGYRAPSPSSR
ncbi:MAG: GNAT family N-acetyltransferase [Sporichthyaceae bacterium]